MTRPRSAKAHGQVLEAAVGLFAERGIDGTSMDAIAAASGVSKATIYKHWPDKDKLALEVLSHLHGLDEEQPVFESGDVRADLIAQLSYHPAEDRAEMRGRIMPHLIAYSAVNREFGETWRELVIDRQRSAIKKLLERGVKQRQLIKELDFDLGIAMLMGPMIYRHIFVNRKAGKTPPNFIEELVLAFWRAFAR
jgi:AcrR family transcriptional regulator